MFVPKPVLHINYKDIMIVEFHRMEETMITKNFDFEVVLKNGDKTLFSGVEKSDGQPIIDHFKKQKVKV